MAGLNWNRRRLKDTLQLQQGGEELQRKELIAEVHLCFNFISEVPSDVFQGFASLTQLSLSCNSLTEIPVLAEVPALKELHLANNHISEIRNLESVPNLEILSLRCNRIQCVENLTSNGKLKSLTLSGNLISRISQDGMPSLQHLTFLGLYGNQLSAIEEVLQLLSGMPQLQEAYLGCNPFSNGQPLTLTSVLLRMRHIEMDQVAEFVSQLGQCVADAQASPAGSWKVALGTLCKRYAQQNIPGLEKLASVSQMLIAIKQSCPLLVCVDGEMVFCT